MRNAIRSALAAAVAVGLIGVAPLPAIAARPAPPPAVQVDATVTGFDVAVSYGVNRGARQVLGQECEIVDLATEVATSVTCDSTPERRSSGRQSVYSLESRVTTAEQYEFRVEFSLADGSVASGSDAFEIEPGPAAAFEVSGLRNQSLYSGQPVASQWVVVEAVDEYGNRATGYDGTVTFDGGDYPDSEVLPPDSTLTDGRGVFVVNVGSSQNDCFYGDIGLPDCLGYWRVTATDTADSSITGYQRVTTTVFIVNLPSNFITPEGGECASCLTDPTGTVVIDTTQPLTLTSTAGFIGTFSATIEGVTTAGGTFTASVSGTTLVADLGDDVQLVVPTTSITRELTVQSLTSLESQFGSVEVEVPYVNPNTGVTQTTNAYTTLFNFQGVICAAGQCW